MPKGKNGPALRKRLVEVRRRWRLRQQKVRLPRSEDPNCTISMGIHSAYNVLLYQLDERFYYLEEPPGRPWECRDPKECQTCFEIYEK